MSEAKFTKGPWTASAQNGTPGHCLVAQVFGADGQSLALIEATECENKASAIAQLMAAAPDLYETLKHLIIGIGMGCDLTGAVDSARAALAKARGEAQ